MSHSGQIEVLLFAGLKQRVGASSVRIDVSFPTTVAGLLETLGAAYPQLGGQLSHCRVAVGQEFASDETPVEPGVEVAVIPPVSGGHDGEPSAAPDSLEFRQDNCVLSSRPLSLDAVVSTVDHPGAGGLTTFTGNVRLHSRGKIVEFLEYEAYGPMAVSVMAKIAAKIEDEVEGSRVAIHHRFGRLEIGEAAVVIAASAPHRAEAFEACRAAIEALKQDVPIWKKEVATDGAEWIGQGP